jgi:hypothetical protein
VAVPLFTNNATGTLAGSYTSGATAITLTAGQGAKFPSPAGGDWFMATIVDASNNIEIVKVTARAADTFTVVRGQEGTAARALGAGEKVELRVTAGALDAIKSKVQQTADIADGAITNAKLAANAVDSAKLADGAVSTAAKIADGIITAAKLAVNAVTTALGFTPVQQGGGTGQTNNKIYLGWSEPKLRAQVDTTDLGFIICERDDGDPSTVGYRGLPQVALNANTIFGVTHGGKQVLHSSGGAHTYTVPDDTTPFQAGSAVSIVNLGGAVTISPAAGVTLTWMGSGATGARSLAANGTALVRKVSNNSWIIEGTNLS